MAYSMNTMNGVVRASSLSTTSPRFVQLGELPAQLRAIGVPKHVDAGWTIISADDNQTGCCYVERGLVEGGSINKDGDESVTFIFGEQSMFLETSMFEGEMLAHSSTAPLFRAVAATDLLFFSRKDIVVVMQTDAEVSNYIAHSIAQKMVVFRSLYNEARCHSMLWRVTNLLLSFAESDGVKSNNKLKLDYSITQSLFARMLGANRVSVARSMKQLKETGLVEKTNDLYYITDLDKLKSFFNKLN